MNTTHLSLDNLHAHPANSNVMPEPLLAKLVEHLRTADRYPPIIVRPSGEGYQILDGHHRVIALRRLGRIEARCDVWDVGDDEALLLLATLNRLQGHDDPRKRASLVDALRGSHDLAHLADRLPEDRDRLRKLLQLNEAPPTPRPPQRLADMPVAVHFFLRPAERDAVERKLREVGGSREAALLQLMGCGG